MNAYRWMLLADMDMDFKNVSFIFYCNIPYLNQVTSYLSL